MSETFLPINAGYDRTFCTDKLTLGLVVPIENYACNAIPSMQKQVEMIQLADALGFASVWLRDVPFNVPSFGDAGHIYDPFVYLGLLAATTKQVALGVASIVLPLRHPVHVAKAAASVDVLSNGRMILGVASGDRPEEYPAMGIEFEKRGELFRESLSFIHKSASSHAEFQNHFGAPGNGIDLIPKPSAGRLPTLITGSSQQNDDWLAKNGDGWMLYPRDIFVQEKIIRSWRARTRAAGLNIKPAMQPLYIDLTPDKYARARPIHLGFQLGVETLKEYLESLEHAGVNHIAFNLRFNQLPVEETMRILADELLPRFSFNNENQEECSK